MVNGGNTSWPESERLSTCDLCVCLPQKEEEEEKLVVAAPECSMLTKEGL
jgi:hypothetical protein